MALSKIYTLGKVESLLRILTSQLGLSKIKFGDIRAIVNKNTLDLAELLNGASQPFYQISTTLNDAASSIGAFVTGASYVDSTKTITKSAHGLTAADVGRRIAYFNSTFGDPGNLCIAQIASYVSSSAFTVSQALGTSVPSGLNYAVMAEFTGSYLDISSLKIDRIIKLVSSNLGEFSPEKDSDFENFSGIDEYDNEIVYNHAGEKLHLKKGSSVATAYGTITLDYYKLPDMVTNRTEYIDMKDNYIPLLIDRCKLDLYELSEKAAPTNLTDSVTMKVRELIQAGVNKDVKIKDKASG